jgi:hypothetical protein
MYKLRKAPCKFPHTEKIQFEREIDVARFQDLMPGIVW